MVEANRFLQYWYKFFGGLSIQDKKHVRSRDRGGKIVVSVLVFTFIILTVFIAGFSEISYAATAGTIGSWNSTTSYPFHVENPTPVAYNGYIYVLGGWGWNPGELPYAHDDVYLAKVNSNGTLQPWTSTTHFSTGRYLHATTLDPEKRIIYIIGGWDTNGKKLNDVQYAPILNNGYIGAWSTTTPFPPHGAQDQYIYGHTAVVYNGYLYVIGGAANIEFNDVYFAKINSDGSLGTWEKNFFSFNSPPRRYHTTAAYNGNFYVTGGLYVYTGALGDVQYAPARPSPNFIGPLEQWKTTTPLPITRYFHTSVAANNYLYVLGGENCNYNDFSGSLLSDVLYARINSDGTVGTWNSTTSLPNVLKSHASVVSNGYIYIIGGSTGDCSTGFTKDTVLYAQINAQDTTPPVTTPSHYGGCYINAIDVVLSCNDGLGSGCDKTYYTTDGTNPTTASPVYSTPIRISSNTTLKFFSTDLSGNAEEVKTIYYEFTATPPENYGVILILHTAPPGSTFTVPSGLPVTQVVTMYAHLDINTINKWVKEGDPVLKGWQIGVIGPTPAGSTGPHLHFELRTDTSIGLGSGYSDTYKPDGWTDPSDFIDANPSDTWGIEKVSISNDGTQGNNDSYSPAISPDGQYVAFRTLATNIFLNASTSLSGSISMGSSVSAQILDTTPGTAGVYLYDRLTSSINEVNDDGSSTLGNGKDFNPAFSTDGRYKVFASDASNLVSGDTNEVSDIFVYDKQTGVISRVSIDSAGNQANGMSYDPGISGDGRYVVFTSNASNLVPNDTNGSKDIFVHDIQTGETRRVSVDSAGNQANGDSYQPSISADGQYVAFVSEATNLVAGDTNGVADIFVSDIQSEEIWRISVDNNGNQSNGASYHPSISSEGRHIAFESDASNLVPNDTNGCTDIFTYDRLNSTIQRISVGENGEEADGPSYEPRISSYGMNIAFISKASNLVSGDTNGKADIFVAFLKQQEIADVSVSPTSHDFGFINVGSSSAPQTFTISNTGTADLVIGTITLTGTNTDQFIKQNDNCSGQTLATSFNCTVQVVFSPKSTGTKSASLNIPSNDPDTPTLNVPLYGTGILVPISLQSPSNGAAFNSCSLINRYQPLFSWITTEPFTRYTILFSTSPTDFTTRGILITRANIPGTKNSWTPAIGLWKRIMTSSYNNGSIRVIYWKISGTKPDRTTAESEVRSFSIGTPQAVTINAPLNGATLSSSSPPTFNFNSNCNVKFRLEFSRYQDFDDSTKIRGFIFTTRDPNVEAVINRTLTLGQWTAIKRLVGTRGYFRIKAWDGIKRETLSEVRSFYVE